MRTNFFYIALGSVIVTVCVVVIVLAVYGFVVDLATSPIVINITNAYENSVDLQHDIESAYPAESVIIRFEDWSYHHHQVLTVTLVNSAANQLTGEEQRVQAAEIARLALQNNKGKTRFIRITFIERTGFLGIPFGHENSFLFRRADLLQE